MNSQKKGNNISQKKINNNNPFKWLIIIMKSQLIHQSKDLSTLVMMMTNNIING